MQRHFLARLAAATLAALLLLATLGATGGQRHGAPASALFAHAAPVLNAGHGQPGVTHLPPGTMQLEPAQHARAHMLANGDPPGDFPFQTTQSADGLIYIHSYGQYPSFGSDFLGEVQQALRERVQPRLGYGLRARVDIYTYNSRGDFLAGAQPESPQITGAYSLFSPSQIYMPL